MNRSFAPEGYSFWQALRALTAPHRLRDAAVVLVVCILAWSPFPLGSNRPWSWSILMLLTGSAALLWLASVWARPERLLPQVRKVCVPMTFAALALLWGLVQILPVVPASLVHPLWPMAAAALKASPSDTVSLAPWQTETELLKLGAYAMMAWLVYSLAHDSSRARLLLKTFTITGAFYACYALLFALQDWHQFELFYGAPDVGNRVAAPFVNRNSLATYAGLVALSCGIQLFARAADTRGRVHDLSKTILHYLEFAFGRGVALLLASLLSFSLVLATGSLGGTISLLAGVAVVAAVAGFALLRAKTDRWTALTAVTIAAALTALVLFNSNALVDRLETIGSAGLSEDLRISLWTSAQRMIHDAPLVGLGLGSFEKAYPLYAQTVQPFIMDKAHNDYLELAAGWGLPAAAAWWAAILWLAGLCVRGVFVRHRDRQYSLLAIGATALVALHSLFDFSLQIPAVALQFAALLGLGVAQSFSERERQAPGA